jgi:hypothetical protein
MAISRVHGICYRDWTSVHGGNRLVINGGWHDAGDLSQGLGNTGEAVYAMFSLAERLRARDKDPELYERLRHKPSVHILGESIKLLEDVHLIIILPMPAGPGCCAAAVSLSFRPSQVVIRIRT